MGVPSQIWGKSLFSLLAAVHILAPTSWSPPAQPSHLPRSLRRSYPHARDTRLLPLGAELLSFYPIHGAGSLSPQPQCLGFLAHAALY